VPKVVIVGAGQSGLQLGIALRASGIETTIVSNRTADDFFNGRVMSSQCMFSNALDTERRLKINFWEDITPTIGGISLAIPNPEEPTSKAIDWAARLDRPAQATDQRVKYPRWMQHFEDIGGELLIHEATVDDLESYAATADLVVIAAGKGDITRLFERDDSRSPFSKPMRSLALTYITGLEPRAEYPAVCFNIIPGVGEYFVFPAYTTSGPCEIMVFEGVVDGPLDCWDDVSTPDEHLAKSKWILETFIPWEAERARDVELTDPSGTLAGRVPPTVRKPVARLPSGACVFGMADVVVLNDPITGQGSNNAAKCAESYHDSIVSHEGAFDHDWMQATFDRYWSYASAVTTWTNALLTPPPPHVLNLLGAANGDARIAHRFVNGFDDPRDYFEWFMDPDSAADFLLSLSHAPQSEAV
jgi:flavin-dependent dehydrogenase